jgi:hypothetical protein
MAETERDEMITARGTTTGGGHACMCPAWNMQLFRERQLLPTDPSIQLPNYTLCNYY